MNAQLIPRGNLHQLLERPIPATEGHEAAAGPPLHDLLGHELFAGVHVRDDGDAAVDVLVDGGFGVSAGAGAVGSGFLFVADEGGGDDAVNGGGAGEGDEGSGDFAHQADGAGAVDE